MGDAVFVQTLGLAVSMGGIAVAAIIAGIAVYFIEKNMDRDDSH
jgi:uncharacterized membrane protein (DUF485 family)